MSANGKPSPYVKSFFADSVQAALAQGQVELGPDALLLQSREAPPEARHLGNFEVVFGIGAAEPPASEPAPPSDLEAIRRQVEDIRNLLTRFSPVVSAPSASGEMAAQGLIDAGVEPQLAYEIDEAIRQRIKRQFVPRIGGRPLPVCDPSLFLREEISARFEVAPDLGRVTALVGPPGSGKTTTLVKLAIAQGLARGLAVRFISTDTNRIGGADQLRTYAAILGAHFQVADTPAALAQAIDTSSSSALVLIDTPGLSAALLQNQASEPAGLLGRRQDIDTHLVLTASANTESLHRSVARYQAFRPRKLLFTRVDEASSLAVVLCVASRCNIPVSFLCGGQAIPEDLEPASKERVVDSLVRRLPSLVEAVA